MPISTFADGFGRRFRFEADAEPPIETLHLREDLSRMEGVEAAISTRIASLAAFSHPRFSAVRRVDRTKGGLVLTSTAIPGTRLADVLRAAERRWMDPELLPALGALLQVTSVVAALHEHGRHLSHAALGPERIVIREDGSAVVVEGALGGALELSDATRAGLWKQYRVAVPAVAGAPSLGPVTDVIQLGVLALALVRGRLLGRDDFPARLPELLHEAASADPLGHRPAVPRAIRSWISRALQFDSRAAFRSAREAESALSSAIVDSGLERPRDSVVAEWVTVALTGRAAAAAPPAASPAAVTSASTADDERTPARVEAPAAAGGRPRRSPSFLIGTLRASAIVAGLIVLWGGTYLGARSLLGFPSILFPTGHLMVESHPAGLEVLLDGEPQGRTPLTVEVRAGRYTLALRSARATTLVPVTVEAGAWHTERIEVRKGRPPRRTSAVRKAAPETTLEVLPWKATGK